MNLCKNCKHFWEVKTTGHPSMDWCIAVNGQEHPVYGNPIDGIKPEVMRIGGPCGWEGRLYEEKEPGK